MSEILTNLIKLEELLDTDMAPEFTDQAMEDEIENTYNKIRDHINKSNIDRVYFDERLTYAVSSLRTALGLQNDPGASKETAKRNFIHYIGLLKGRL